MGAVRIMNVLRMAECCLVHSLGYGNQTELYLGYVCLNKLAAKD